MYVHLEGSPTLELEFHDNRVILTYYTAYNYTHLYSKCLDLYWFASWLGVFWPSGGHKQSGKFSRFFSKMFFTVPTWYSVGCTKYWVHVSPEWGLYDLVRTLSNELTRHTLMPVNGRIRQSPIALFIVVSCCAKAIDREAHLTRAPRTDHCGHKLYLVGGCWSYSRQVICN